MDFTDLIPGGLMRHLERVLFLAVLGALLAPPVPASAQQTKPYLRPQQVSALPSAPPDHRLFYGESVLQVSELRLPSGPGPYPVAIVLHGGCWVSAFAGIENSAPLADALRNAGVATWNVEYRRVDNPGGGWPGTFDDVAAAADYLREMAPTYQLDLERVVAIGHSAGGHLALWLAARSRLPEKAVLYRPDPLRLRGAVSLGGPGDLAASREHLSEPCGSDVVSRLMGGGREEVPERYREGSPAELLPLGVPQTFITGEDDNVVPGRFADDYRRVATGRGDTVDHIVVKNAAHHEYMSPNSDAWPVVRDAVLSLLGLKEEE